MFDTMAQAMGTADWVPEDTFGARLALIRQHYGWNVKEAAQACDVPDTSWANWEGGRTPRKFHDVARKIADASGVDYRWLVAGGPLRSRCFAALPTHVGQLELFSDDGPAWSHRPDLLSVALN